MPGTEAADALTWMFSLVASDATILALSPGFKWYKDVAVAAPALPPWPFGIGAMQSAVDVQFMSSVRVAVDGLMTLKVVGKASDFTTILRPIYKRVDALVHGAQGSTSDVLLVGRVIRETPLDYSEIVGGDIIRHLGGVYRFLAQ